MLREVLTIMRASLLSVTRTKSVVFSAFILPVMTLWSTWWVTAEQVMVFELYDSDLIVENQLHVHILTGGLTAIAITAGIFGFILTAENQRLTQRLRIVGYSLLEINVGWFLSLLVILFFASLGTFALTIVLYYPANVPGVFVAILLTTVVYAGFGYFVGSLYPKVMEGTLIVLIFSFIDLMLFSNPMGTEIYMEPWTRVLPGYWPTQLVLHSGFVEKAPGYLKPVVFVLLETLVLLLVPVIIRSGLFSRGFHRFVKGVRV